MEVYKEWLEKAMKDMASAKYNYRGNFWDNAAFFAHQAAEKALKAIFIKRFGVLVKVHDLVKLAAKLRCPKPVLEICNNLNPYYIGTRYPIGKKYTKEIAEEAIKNGEKVIEWVEKNLGK